ncbi:MAG TPA: hypothetical protein VK213_13525 [Bacteroidales bacterium]|nr:hypothetical protein [Bacteroidales bacterium]
MAHGLKYELFCKTLYKLKLSFKGYTGPQIDRNVPVNPFKLRKDKAAYVRGTSLEFGIREEVDFEFLEFYTNNARHVKAELYGPEDELIWVGFNLPQQYQVPYKPCPVSVWFTASDGLGLLKQESFALSGLNSLLDIIRHCVDNIGLSLGYSIAINLFAENHDNTRSCLAQTFVLCEIFEGMNCYQVIEEILKPFNAEITQSKGRWRITRDADKESSRMLYTSGGIYEGTEAAPEVQTLGQLGGAGVNVHPKGMLNLSLQPGGKQVNISHDYGKRASFFPNPAFGWGVDGDFVPEVRYNDNGPYVFIPGRNDTQQWLSKTIPVVNVPGEDFVFSLKMAAVGSRLYGGLPISVLMDITFFVYLTDGINERWLTETGWVSESTDITKQTASTIGGEPRFNELPPIITNEIPFSGDLTIALGRYHSMDGINDSSWTIAGLAYTDLNVYFVQNGQLYASGHKTNALFTGSTEPSSLEDIDLKIGDAPDVENAALLYKNILLYSDGTPI